MNQRKIPGTGERIGVIGLGTWRTFDVGRSPRERAPLEHVLERLVAAGGALVDTSPMYASAEPVLGDLIRATGLRDRLFIATKVWTRGRASGVWQMEESLRKLRVDRVDLMQVHNLLDAEIHLDTLAEWKREGRVRHVGITHYERGAHERLERLMRSHEPDFVQVNYSIAEPEAADRVLPVAHELGIAVIANRPFAGGELLRSVRRRPLPEIARELGCGTWPELLLKWIIAEPSVTCVIPATSKPDHMAANASAGEEPLPDEAMRRAIEATVRV